MVGGTQVGAYRVIRQIGEGGMGAVWLAEHTILKRLAAIKVLHASYSTRPDIVTRFFNEARAATAISDPGIVQVFDFGQDADGSAYIVMEMLEGETLGARLKARGVLHADDALRIMRQVAVSLGAAHAAGIVHRDLKPDNIFLVRDSEVAGGERPKILDFGIAKLVGDKTVKTQTSAMMGTPMFMSPEQCRGAGKVDQRSDVYALGCVLFVLVTGTPVFDAEGVGDIIAMHLREPPPLPSSRMPALSAELDALVMRCLAKDPADRFDSASDLAAAIAGLIGSPAREIVTAPSLASTERAAVSPVAITNQDTTLSGSSGISSVSVSSVPVAVRPRGRTLVAAVGALVVTGGVILYAVTRGGSNVETAATPTDAPAAVAVKPESEPEITTRMRGVLARFVVWSHDHAGEPCPTAAALGGDRNDPWGHAMRLTCDEQPKKQMAGLVSAGSDGIEGNADDVASWSIRELDPVIAGPQWTPAPAPVPIAKVDPPKRPKPTTTPTTTPTTKPVETTPTRTVTVTTAPAVEPTPTPTPTVETGQADPKTIAPTSAFSKAQERQYKINTLVIACKNAAALGDCATTKSKAAQIAQLDASSSSRVTSDASVARCLLTP